MLICEQYIYYMWRNDTTNNLRLGSEFSAFQTAWKPLLCQKMPALIHRRFRPLLLAFLLAVVAVPAAYPADNGPFLNGLAQAERRHDYHALLARCDQQITARPNDREAYRHRALARWGARDYDGALTDFRRASDLARRQKAPARILAILAYGRALIRREQHDLAAEAAELDCAVQADHSFTDPLNDLAWIRATNPDASLCDGKQAVELARQACAAVPGSVKYLDTLAAAYAEAGDAKQAAGTEKAAIKAARNDASAANSYSTFMAEAQRRIDLYAGGGRYRDDSAAPTISKAR